MYAQGSVPYGVGVHLGGYDVDGGEGGGGGELAKKSKTGLGGTGREETGGDTEHTSNKGLAAIFIFS